MNRSTLVELLRGFRRGELDEDTVVQEVLEGPLRVDESRDLTLDHHRLLRQGFPEVIFGEGKSTDQILTAARGLASHGHPVLLTRLDDEALRAVRLAYPDARLNEKARTAVLNSPSVQSQDPAPVLVVTAGTTDSPIALEVVETLISLGIPSDVVTDVGVAGVHRLLAHARRLLLARVVIVVAGMDGALPSVVGGITGRPVIAVPTSVGYGVSAGGFAALATMLGSCAAGVTVVNIDNGFGAAVGAWRILTCHEEARKSD